MNLFNLDSSISIILVFLSLIEISQSIRSLDNDLCKCEMIKDQQSRIINGNKVDAVDLKWVASIFRDYLSQTILPAIIREVKNHCTASVINERFLISAANCFFQYVGGVTRKKNISQMFVAVNFGHRMTDAYLPNVPRRKIKNVYVPPGYVGKFFHPSKDYQFSLYDIALVEIEEPFVLGKDILPACLNEEKFDSFEDVLILAGYGDSKPLIENDDYRVVHGNQQVLIQKQDNLLMANFEEEHSCLEHYGDFNSTDAICASPSDNQTNFVGDTGGPLHYRISNSLVIVGIAGRLTFRSTDFVKDPITNTFTRKITKPQVFTRVSAYLPWIESFVGKNRCKSKR